MALITCPECQRPISDTAPACVHCGRPAGALPSSATSQHSTTPAVPGVNQLPLFPVATHKFIVLSICSLGIYERYWAYQNWKRLKHESGEDLSPFWRAVFAPLWGFSLFRRIRAMAVSEGVPSDWSFGVLALFYFLLTMATALPEPWFLLGLAAPIPCIPVLATAWRVNALHAALSTEGPNDNYSTGNVALILIGGAITVAAIADSLGWAP